MGSRPRAEVLGRPEVDEEAVGGRVPLAQAPEDLGEGRRAGFEEALAGDHLEEVATPERLARHADERRVLAGSVVARPHDRRRADVGAAHAADYVEDDITPRQKMLADVVRNVLPGRARAELDQALGPSLETFYFSSTGRDLIYPLGPERDSWFGIDSERLLIWLDESGRFRRYAIVND